MALIIKNNYNIDLVFNQINLILYLNDLSKIVATTVSRFAEHDKKKKKSTFYNEKK